VVAVARKAPGVKRKLDMIGNHKPALKSNRGNSRIE